MVIKKCKRQDIPAVGAFYDKVVKYLDEHINYPKWMYKSYPSEAYVRDMTVEDSQYICMEEDKLIGAFVLNSDPQGNYQKGKWSSFIPDGEYLIVHALAIDPELQAMGLGSDIIGFCIEETKRRGLRAIRLDIVPGNIPAKKLYEKNGFSYIGDEDLERGIEGIPVFSLYELNIK